MAKQIDTPQLVAGNFNNIWNREEKDGGNLVLDSILSSFNYSIEAVDLFKILNVGGAIFTWNNEQKKDGCIACKRDRSLVIEA